MKDDGVVRVATFNIHNGIGYDTQYKLGRIVKTIRMARPDVIGLQEIGQHWNEASGWDDQVALLAKHLGMHYFSAPIYTLAASDPNVPPRRFGCAFLSRYPIIKSRNYELIRVHTFQPEKGPQQLPGFGMIQLDAENETWTLYNTHLAWQSRDLRRQQISQMKRYLAKDIKRENPFVVMGDFNATPDAEEMEAVFRIWRDAWDEAGSGHGYTFPAQGPNKRIDYVFVSPEIRVRSAQVVPTNGSDHLLLVADVHT